MEYFNQEIMICMESVTAFVNKKASSWKEVVIKTRRQRQNAIITFLEIPVKCLTKNITSQDKNAFFYKHWG